MDVDFRSSFFAQDPGRLNVRAADQAIMEVCKAIGELIHYSMFE
jgi:hypothetical protein